MFLANLALGLFRRVRRDDVREAGESVDVGVLVDHLDLPGSNPGDEELAVDPDSDDRVFGHEGNLAADPRSAESTTLVGDS